jgi:hypothetical protein
MIFVHSRRETLDCALKMYDIAKSKSEEIYFKAPDSAYHTIMKLKH